MAAMDADDMKTILEKIGEVRTDMNRELGNMHEKINDFLIAAATTTAQQEGRNKACDDRHKHDGNLGRAAVQKAVEWGVVGALLIIVGRSLR